MYHRELFIKIGGQLAVMQVSKTKKIILAISEEMEKALKEECKIRKLTSLQEVIRDILGEYFDQRTPRVLSLPELIKQFKEIPKYLQQIKKELTEVLESLEKI